MGIFERLSRLSREQKNEKLTSLLTHLPEARILDLGTQIGEGTYSFIHNSKDRAEITCINIEQEHIKDIKQKYPEIDVRVGDARNLDFPDKSFDVVYSNAVIEHVGGLEDQFKMASEVMRVGKNWFITTPNRFFPFEFHMRLPLVTWLPHDAMHWFGSHFGFNHVHRKYMAGNHYQVRLITPSGLQKMFPTSRIIQQRVTIMPETLIAVGGERFRELVT